MAKATARINWYVRHRQAWIAEMFRVYGFINRSHLQRMFGISSGQANLDLKRYLAADPTVTYNLSKKRYQRR